MRANIHLWEKEREIYSLILSDQQLDLRPTLLLRSLNISRSSILISKWLITTYTCTYAVVHNVSFSNSYVRQLEIQIATSLTYFCLFLETLLHEGIIAHHYSTLFHTFNLFPYEDGEEVTLETFIWKSVLFYGHANISRG